MSDNDLEKNSDLPEIHPHFHCLETGKPFTKCSKCDEDLATSSSPYLVHKDWTPYDLSSEFALCFSCLFELRSLTSTHSRQKIDHYFHSSPGMNYHNSLISNLEKNTKNIEKHVDHCIACCSPIRFKEDHFSMSSLCLNDRMMSDFFPIAVCGKCEEEIVALLSKETRDSWDGFYDPIFNTPPADLVDLPKTPSKPVLV